MSVCVGASWTADGLHLSPAGNEFLAQRLLRLLATRDETRWLTVAPSSRARRPARRFQATAPPRWRGPVLCFSVSAGPPATPRQRAAGIGAAARTALGRGRRPACVCVSAAAKDSRLSPQTLPAQDCAQGEGYPGPAAAAAPFSAARRRGRRSGPPPEGGCEGRERECAAEVKHASSVCVAQIKRTSAASLRRRARCPASAPARRPAPPCSCPPAWRRRAPVSAPGYRLECLRPPQASIHPSGCLGNRACS